MDKLITTIKIRLSNKLNTNVIELLEHEEVWNEYSNQLQLAVDTYNKLINSDDSVIDIMLNTQHLRRIYLNDLPNYMTILGELNLDEALQDKVFSELGGSDYFDEVWQIPNPTHMLINLMILLYRTSLLHKYPQLRKQGAQISSTLEEMIVLNKINGHDGEVFFAIQHWIKNWEQEGFSEELAKLILSA